MVVVDAVSVLITVEHSSSGHRLLLISLINR